MIATIDINGKSIKTDLSKPYDLSIPVTAGPSLDAFFIPPAKIEPFTAGSFTGSIEKGASCNVNNILFNPHGNATHTECVGHISREFYSINDVLKTFHFLAKLVTIEPQRQNNGDFVVMAGQVIPYLERETEVEALIIRTLSNGLDKRISKYSGTNPPYIDPALLQYMFDKGMKHFLTDLPSVDREEDGGVLSAHHAFWGFPHATRTDSTITELIYVPNELEDALYLLNLQAASFENDAAPSRPLLFRIL